MSDRRDLPPVFPGPGAQPGSGPARSPGPRARAGWVGAGAGVTAYAFLFRRVRRASLPDLRA